MVLTCCVPGCLNDADCDVSFYHLPLRDEKILQHWIEAIDRENLAITRSTVVCSDHFTDEDFHNAMQARLMPQMKIKLRLKPNAIPSVFGATAHRVREQKLEIDVVEQFEMRESVQLSSSDDLVMEVKCGGLEGRMHRNLFVCPGIHQECIEFHGKFITPKMFSVMGDKEKLKDWKNAIRINGISIRKMVDSGQLEFWNHRELCTGRCASRNTGTSKYDTPKYENADALPYVPFVNASMNNEHGYTVLRQMIGEDSPIPGTSPHRFPTATATGPGLSPCRLDGSPDSIQTITIKQEPGTESDDSQDHKVAPGGNVTILGQISTATTSDRIQQVSIVPVSASEASPQPDMCVRNIHSMACNLSDQDIVEGSVAFWHGILEVGLIDDFFREIKTALDGVKVDLIKYGVRDQDSKKISRVVMELGLMAKLKWKLAAHKTETVRQKDRLLAEIEALKRRVQEQEQRQQELKRKSECFDQLMDLGTPKKLKTEVTSSTLPKPATDTPISMVTKAAADMPSSTTFKRSSDTPNSTTSRRSTDTPNSTTSKRSTDTPNSTISYDSS